MEFLDISSLVATYPYVVEIEQQLQHEGKKEFGGNNQQQHKKGKGNPNSHNI
jgi:hypothetical protein